jgi:hypothetical protein
MIKLDIILASVLEALAITAFLAVVFLLMAVLTGAF